MLARPTSWAVGDAEDAAGIRSSCTHLTRPQLHEAVQHGANNALTTGPDRNEGVLTQVHPRWHSAQGQAMGDSCFQQHYQPPLVRPAWSGTRTLLCWTAANSQLGRKWMETAHPGQGH